MSDPKTKVTLDQLKSLYPDSSPQNPWYIVATVAYSASNQPDKVPAVFQHALESVDSFEEKLLLARKLREALFKSGLTSGYARAINSLAALHSIMPEDLRDTKTMRDPKATLETHARTGEELFRSTYGDTATSVQDLLDSIYPDMGWFSNTIGYGLVYGFTSILSPLETSYMLVASLIASDTPLQITWHLDGARRNGATLEETIAVRRISMEVASSGGVRWRDGVPEIRDIGPTNLVS